eukprot:TRINITY_DN26406_c0_g1_i1.p1 TRINITY_DN26406_c0_g1~~TRINITY_DN26406_c0_g1_i1.p1  ORF type:complete len:461 (+),score=158.24 TRINITY_DN26406_c0_g1_i1:87-1469(+)
MADFWVYIIVAVVVLLIVLYLFSRYIVCAPSQYAVFTGLMIKDMSIAKKGFRMPFQKVSYVDMKPHNYSFQLVNMSKEMVEFELPVSFTIGPCKPDPKRPEAFKNYALMMSKMQPEEVQNTVLGVIQGEFRVLCASLTIMEIFSDKDKFRKNVNTRIQADLDLFGLVIFNANIEEMSDMQGSEYFKYRRMKALEGAVNDSRVEVAEARRRGDIGEKEKQAQARKEVARIEADAVASENERKIKVSESNMELSVARADYKKKSDVADIEGKTAAMIRKAELDVQLEQKRQQAEIEKARANLMSRARVQAEVDVTEADGKAKAEIKLAEGNAGAKKLEAEAELYRLSRIAEANRTELEAQAAGLEAIMAASKNNPQLAQFSLGLKANLYPTLAKYSAEAIKGLNPRVTIWNTGGEPGKTDPMAPIRGLAASLPPMMDMLQGQGVEMPKWLPQQDPEAAVAKV